MKNETGSAIDIHTRHRTLLIIWAAMLMTVGIYFALAFAMRTAPGEEGDETVLLVLIATGATIALASFIIKQRFLSRAVAEQKPDMVTTAYIVGLAMSEAAGLLGLVSAFIFGGTLPYILFLIAAVGMLLHFPRRDDLLAAAYREGGERITEF